MTHQTEDAQAMKKDCEFLDPTIGHGENVFEVGFGEEAVCDCIPFGPSDADRRASLRMWAIEQAIEVLGGHTSSQEVIVKAAADFVAFVDGGTA